MAPDASCGSRRSVLCTFYYALDLFQILDFWIFRVAKKWNLDQHIRNLHEETLQVKLIVRLTGLTGLIVTGRTQLTRSTLSMFSHQTLTYASFYTYLSQ
jgi:hypothetical protein